MRKPIMLPDYDPTYLPPLPSWVTIGRSETPESVSFLSGASLAMLHMMLADLANILPAELLRNRLALRAAEACLTLEGRRDSEAEIRDAYSLVRAGDASGATGPTSATGAVSVTSAMGPAGEMYVRWRKLSVIGLKRRDWLVRLRSCVPEQVAEKLPEWIDTAMDQGADQGVAQGRSPVTQAAGMIGLVITAFPREEASALICGDLVLARALGWAHPVPLLGVQLKRKDLLLAAEQGRGDDLGVACHRAAANGAQDAVRLGHDLTRRAQHLRAIVPKLRAKGSSEAVALFLSEDAVLPGGMLSPRIKGTNVAMTDRAARRLCDRLVELGVVFELTGRSTFRLYGI